MGRSSGALRITGGVHRGRRIEVARGTRPTQERVREALLSRWTPRIPGASLLELFCGSGAVSLEALSRGAERAVLVDGDALAVATARRNLASLEDTTRVHRAGVHRARLHRARLHRARLPQQWSRLASTEPGSFDLVFLDPPYDFPQIDEVVALAASVLAPDGELALEHDRRVPVDSPVDLAVEDQRTYGETAITFLRRKRP